MKQMQRQLLAHRPWMPRCLAERAQHKLRVRSKRLEREESYRQIYSEAQRTRALKLKQRQLLARRPLQPRHLLVLNQRKLRVQSKRLEREENHRHSERRAQRIQVPKRKRRQLLARRQWPPRCPVVRDQRQLRARPKRPQREESHLQRAKHSASNR